MNDCECCAQHNLQRVLVLLRNARKRANELRPHTDVAHHKRTCTSRAHSGPLSRLTSLLPRRGHHDR